MHENSIDIQSCIKMIEKNQNKNEINLILGKDENGFLIERKLSDMHHLIVCGPTAAGKTYFFYTLLLQILNNEYKDYKLLIYSSNIVDYIDFNNINHMLIPTRSDWDRCTLMLDWVLREIKYRLELFSIDSVRDIEGYNKIASERSGKKLERIIIILDDVFDLMDKNKSAFIDQVKEINLKGRQTGMHLIISVFNPNHYRDLKSLFPSRLNLREKIKLKNKNTYSANTYEDILTDKQLIINLPRINISNFKQLIPVKKFQVSVDDYSEENIKEKLKVKRCPDDELDELYNEAVEFVKRKEKASASMLQREFRIGFNRAVRLIESLEANEIIGPEDGSKPRKVLILPENNLKAIDIEVYETHKQELVNGLQQAQEELKIAHEAQIKKEQDSKEVSSIATEEGNEAKQPEEKKSSFLLLFSGSILIILGLMLPNENQLMTAILLIALGVFLIVFWYKKE